MEEVKAAEYYNDLLQKGGNAARFKQGLGFGTPATSAPVPNKEEHGSLGYFVKGSNLEKDAGLHKEINIESIRNKLQKREGRSMRELRHPEGDGQKSLRKPESEEKARRKTPDRCESEEREVRDKSGRLRSSVTLGKARASGQETSDKERRGRSRSPRWRNRRKSRSSSDDNNSSQSSGRRRRRESDGSVSRSRHGRRSSPTITKRSSYDGRTRNGGHSRSRRRDIDYKGAYRRGRDYSPHSRRERSPSPSPHKNYRYNHTRDRSTGRADSPHTSRSGRRRETDERDDRSSGRQRDGKTEATLFSTFTRAKEKASERDYSETLGERVKAKASLQLSEHHENRTEDLTNRTSDNWERFDFDKDAPLDDDTKLDYFGDGTGTTDDTLFLKNTGSSYLSSHSQVKREALVTAAHEAAIFGPREGLTLKTLEPDREAVGRKKFKNGGESPRHCQGNTEDRDPQIAAPFVNSVLSDQVVAMQQGGSWQDRALKMRKAREVARQN